MSIERDVLGYEGLYGVTTDGRVWAYPKKSRSQGRWLKQTISNLGYVYVCLFKDGIRKNHYVHRLVALAYLSTSGAQVNHRNGIRADNRLDNLEWVSASENKKHAHSIGLTVIKPSQRAASRRNITAYNQRKCANG